MKIRYYVSINGDGEEGFPGGTEETNDFRWKESFN